MRDSVFRQFISLIYEESGINLTEKKRGLLESRISRRMRELNLEDPADYLLHIRSDESHLETVRLIDSISTNVTYFFREPAHFEFFRKEIASIAQSGQKEIKIWCAASSTGEEPYTIGMELLDCLKNRPINIRLLATDISTKVLNEAKEGVYSSSRMKGIPVAYRSAYFTKFKNGKDEFYRVTPQLRDIVSFCRLNLASPPFPMSGPFDGIFIRNVMIYFDNEVKGRLLHEAYRLLKSGGFLIIGHSESLAGANIPGLERVGNSIFRKR